ncbi:hypothetical protein BV20DRAFT_672336 [Pilatotrama ljubarskyi]|nr:hypothetical protein BV20DRAFT_672336 [Pilatotrama ljubarskyi]
MSSYSDCHVPCLPPLSDRSVYVVCRWRSYRPAVCKGCSCTTYLVCQKQIQQAARYSAFGESSLYLCNISPCAHLPSGLVSALRAVELCITPLTLGFGISPLEDLLAHTVYPGIQDAAKISHMTASRSRISAEPNFRVHSPLQHSSSELALFSWPPVLSAELEAAAARGHYCLRLVLLLISDP